MTDPLVLALRPGVAVVLTVAGVAVRGTTVAPETWARSLAASGLGLEVEAGDFLYLRDAEVGGYKVGFWRARAELVTGIGLVAMR